jgi:DNA helicase II / ATP-dependent DNA helicase PcrA
MNYQLEKFLSSLNSDQRDAVTSPLGPVLVLAGAGSGKTRVLTGRAYFLIAHEMVSPSAVVVMTFTNKAAGELRSRLESYSDKGAYLPWAGTFHSYCVRLLRSYGDAIGLPRDFTIYDTEDTEQVITACLTGRRIPRDHVTPAQMRSWISLLKNGGALSGRHPFHQTAQSILEEYNGKLRASSAVDFDDLLIMPIELFSQRPDLRDAVQRKYDHILVDEFQDTNRHQYELARLLAHPQNNLFVVGDDDQAIYGWRGADYRNIFDFKQALPNTRVFRLERNYRSSQAILDVANDVIVVNRNREPKKMWTDISTGDKVILRQAVHAMDEAHEVVAEIEHLNRAKGMNWRDIAVLFRTNALSRPFEEVLVQRAIPYSVVGGIRFYERKEVKDLIAHLRLLINPDDEQAWRRVLRTPPKGIGDVTIKRIEQEARQSHKGFGNALHEFGGDLEGGPANKKRVQNISQKYVELRLQLKGISLAEQVDRTLKDSGLLEYYEQDDPETAFERIANLNQLVEAASEREIELPGLTMAEFLGEIALVSDIDSYDESPDRVTLMTLHAAKGLEFPAVFIVAIEENLLPHLRSQNSAAELEEERRLFYVGITRARERLSLHYAQSRYVNGSLEIQDPSRFLREIDPEHIQGWSLPGQTRTERRIAFDQEDFTPNKVSWTRQQKTNDREKATIVPYQIGDVVEHPDFGIGVVTAKSGGVDDMKIRVAFEGMGSKLLAVKFAPLKKIN